jgi:release factor glutamine methyltransferase
LDAEKFDLIVSNPPYIATEEYEKLARNVREYEPAAALLAGPDGLDIIRRIISEAPEHLKRGGALLVEIGYNQGRAATELLQASASFDEVHIEKDYAKLDRIIVATRK